jgi:hypothetical protein
VGRLVGAVLLGAAGLAALRGLAGNLLAAAREAGALLGGLLRPGRLARCTPSRSHAGTARGAPARRKPSCP